MPLNPGQKPDRCPNPDCNSQGGFTLKGVRFTYDTRGQSGTLAVEQIPRARVTTWECDGCGSSIEVWQDIE